MTQELENRIRRTQRQMLRMIVKAPRRRLARSHELEQPHDDAGCNDASDRNDKDSNDSGTDSAGDVDSGAPSVLPAADDLEETDPLEPWTDWIKRATLHAETTISRLGITGWTTTVRQRKWEWVQTVATSTTKEWARSVLQWEPGCDVHVQAHRRAGRPKARWWDDLLRYTQQCVPDGPRTVAYLLHLATTDTWDNIKSGYVTQ